MSAAGVALTLLFAVTPALADEPPCPETAVVSGAPQAPRTSTRPDGPITIESDDDDFEFDINGNARICGNVEMNQGDRHIRADCLEYNATEQSWKLKGGIEYSDAVLTVRGNNGDSSPTLGATFEGTQFELPERGARGAARNLRVDSNGKVTLEGVNFTTCPVDQVNWQLEADEIEIDTRTRNGKGRGTKSSSRAYPSPTCRG